MKKEFAAQELVKRLNEKIQCKLNLKETLILGVVLKGLPVAYSLAKMNGIVENFVPIVAQRPIYMQHHVESYFPSHEWVNFFSKQLSLYRNILTIDDVVNTGFTRQKIESIVYSLSQEKVMTQRFAALVLNRKNLANPNFANKNDIYALEVNAINVECDWGLITVPLWDIPIKSALQLCEEYHQRYWQSEQRWVTITY